MQHFEALKRNIDSTRDLQSVVRTMKTLAAVSIRQYEQAVDGSRIFPKQWNSESEWSYWR
ncbi:MAG: hypothetical protein R3C11_00140 [Planctomycetaceae bacterium]